MYLFQVLLNTSKENKGSSDNEILQDQIMEKIKRTLLVSKSEKQDSLIYSEQAFRASELKMDNRKL